MASGGGSVNLVEEFDAAFQTCLSAVMTQEHFNVTNPEETKTSVEQCIQKFLDQAKQLESFFLQKRLILSVHKPEQILKEDIADLKLELQRKEMLIQKHYEKLQVWQNILNRQGQPPPQQQQQQAQQQVQQQAQQPQTGPVQGQSPVQVSAGAAGPTSTAPGNIVQLPQSHHQTSSPMQAPPQLHPQPAIPNKQHSPGVGMAGMTPPGGGAAGPTAAPQMGMPLGPQLHPQASFPQGPLAYLEQTTSNIGMPERR